MFALLLVHQFKKQKGKNDNGESLSSSLNVARYQSQVLGVRGRSPSVVLPPVVLPPPFRVTAGAHRGRVTCGRV